MMGVEAPEICWATNKCQVISLWNCCIWLVNLSELYDDARTWQRQKEIFFSIPKKKIEPTFSPMQPSIQRVKGKFLRVNQPGIKADHLPQHVPRIKTIRAIRLFLTDIHDVHRKHLVCSLQTKLIIIYVIVSVKSKENWKAKVVSVQAINVNTRNGDSAHLSFKFPPLYLWKSFHGTK